ncbi:MULTISPECIES: hypothetical protein [unclassified Shimia]|uniref:hypothetical protein n=1 Tax=unclassified Shimia TaxID=2630038 RepID=UPI003104391A
MSRSRWHILREGDVLTMSRRLPVRWDVMAETTLPDAGLLRTAQQVRQDMWRGLQDLRGFAPIVEVRRDGGKLHLRAGGAVDGKLAQAHVESTIFEILNCPERRERWSRHARHRRGRV